MKKSSVTISTMLDNKLANALHQSFLESPNYARLLARTAKGAKSELNLAGLTDSSKSLLLSCIQHEIKRPVYLITQDNHTSAHYHQELSNLSKYKVFLYPASEVSPYEQVLSSPDNVANQMELLQHILSKPEEPYLVVATAKALMQRVLPKAILKENLFKIKIDDNLSTEEFARRLAELGYSRETLVTLRGEFSIRGDIVDIYPSTGKPIRIELFGDEVESIRSFNIENQRSIKEATEAVIPPRWWVILDSDETEREKLVDNLRKVMDESVKELDPNHADTLRSVMETDLEALRMGSYPESVEYYAPFIHKEFASLADYVDENSVVAIDEWDSISQSLSAYGEKLEKAYNEGHDSGRLLKLPWKLHLEPSSVLTSFEDNQRVYLSSLPVFEEKDKEAIVEFNAKPIEKFGNQMNLVIDKVREWRSEGNRIIISSEQPARMIGILAEWDCPAKYIPGPNDATAIKGQAGNLESEDEKPDQFDDKVWVTRYGFIHGFHLEGEKLVSITDGELFGLKRKPTVYRRPNLDKNYERFTSVTDLKVGDYVVHIKQGIGQFTGIKRIEVDNQLREYLTVQYTGDDKLYVPVDQINLLSRYRGAGDHKPRLSRLGGAEWESTKKRVRRSVKQIAEDLVNLYALRAKQVGFQSEPDTPWQYEMEEAFPFEETPDQWQAIVDCKKDLESKKPMDRLICGDVGFGKTEVAIRSIFKMVMSGKQAAVLVPTTVLAQQHFNTLVERFAPYPIRLGLLSRFRTQKEQREVVRKLAIGECDVVVGTHRMLQKDMSFKDLGLVVIDEEHRFGVAHKEKLKQLRVMVDVLTMSATPIPRTLNMALSGTRDMSLIQTPPINRAPVKTFVGEYKLPLVRTAILHEMERGGQVYFVHNRIDSIENIAFEIKQLVPEARIIIGHGQMNERELENVMLSFNEHENDILLCTTIIESGLDIPNVNTIIINEADKFGLAQLYQLRGRVGRSDIQAYAYCLFKPQKVLTEQAQGRLKAIREFTSLGSGYQIALRDMEIRGVGNILGSEQHGHMVSVGFDLYCKLLGESVAELKGESTGVDMDSQIDINVTAFIPEGYIEDGRQRLIEYKRLADVKSERELNALREEWKDRFGNIPQEAEQLIMVVRLRLLASQAKIQQIKPDMQGLRMMVNYRLQQWLPLQNKLPKSLAGKTIYKPGIAGGQGSSPYVIVKGEGLSPNEQLDLIHELLNAMVSNAETAQAK